MPLNFSLGGKAYPDQTETITSDQIADYARASGDGNEQHRPGPDQIASPIFPVVIGLPLMGAATADPELGVDNPLMIVHGEHEIVHHRPMRPGDRLVFITSLDSVQDKGKNATFSVRVDADTEEGERVNSQTGVMFVRGAGSGQERPPGDGSTGPDRGDRVASFVSTVEESMPAAYAEASGDHNPIHLDEGVARAVGLPGVINHGLGTLSLVAGGLVREVAGGDASRIRRIKVRFTDMVFPGSDLETTVWRSEAGLVFETKRSDGAPVLLGEVEVT